MSKVQCIDIINLIVGEAMYFDETVSEHSVVEWELETDLQTDIQTKNKCIT